MHHISSHHIRTLERDSTTGIRAGFPSSEQVFLSLSPGDHGVLEDQLDPGRPLGHDP